MQIKIISPSELRDVLADKENFLSSLQNTGYIVKGYYREDFIDDIKTFCLNFSKAQKDSWHPCLDGCPDYHRLHDQYPGAYVKSTQHAYYFHSWNENKHIFSPFESVFNIKCSLNKFEKQFNDYFENLPSSGVVARMVIHQYPRGGGGQEEHIDPVSEFALVQTIIQASIPGVDYKSGGLYVNDERFGKINIDALTTKGDLILLSPGVRHGVAAIDPDIEFNWNDNAGRWIIMPIIINSDVVKDPAKKPRGLGKNE